MLQNRKKKDSEGDIAGIKTCDVVAERVDLDTVDRNLFSNMKEDYKIIHFKDTKLPMMVIKSKEACFINHVEGFALYRICSVYGNWNDKDDLSFSKKEADESFANLKYFLHTAIKNIMSYQVKADVKVHHVLLKKSNKKVPYKLYGTFFSIQSIKNKANENNSNLLQTNPYLKKHHQFSIQSDF